MTVVERTATMIDDYRYLIMIDFYMYMYDV